MFMLKLGSEFKTLLEAEILGNSVILKETKSLLNGSNVTFNVTTRSTVIITTTSNTVLIRGCWLVLTSNASGSVVNLSGSLGADISVSSSGATITVANNGAYGTNATMIILTKE